MLFVFLQDVNDTCDIHSYHETKKDRVKNESLHFVVYIHYCLDLIRPRTKKNTSKSYEKADADR